MANHDIDEQKYVKVRKDRFGKLHMCTGCFCDIPVGTRVMKSDYNCDGKFWHDYWCDFCYGFLDHLSPDEYGEGCTLEYLFEVYDSEEQLTNDLDSADLLPWQREKLINEWNERKVSYEERRKNFFEEQEK